MDVADHYLGLVRLGLDEFVSAAAPAALVRSRKGEVPLGGTPDPDATRDSHVDIIEDTFVGSGGVRTKRSARVEIHPLIKKPNAPFPEMITVGRTPNNDVVLRDATVSRLHAYFRAPQPGPGGKRDGDGWTIADGGSKNGTFLMGEPLPARRERAVASGQSVRIGDLELTFYTASELFTVLSVLRGE